jgi:hypothetical protein
LSELNFPTKLKRLTKATLTIVTCCVKIQNDCSESFETRQGFRQRDVLSTLLFNVVLEVVGQRANLQTTDTIYNKETHPLAYDDDIDIVGRSQSAVRPLEREAAKVGLNYRTIRDVSREIQRRIQFANMCFFGLRKHLPPFTPDKIHHSQDLDPPSPDLRQ